MVTRYVYVDKNTGEILWGPGPMPYFILLKDGSALWEITAHSVQDSEAMGIYVVEQVNYREVDPEIEQNDGPPVLSMVNGRPVETWSYIFTPSCRIYMADKIDSHAELLRSIVATKYPGQFKEYDEAYNEAVEVAAIPAGQTISAEDYPFLAADVGVTISEITGNAVADLREAANLVIYKRNAWKSFGSNLRKERLLAKKNIKEAADDAAAKLVYDEFTSRGFAYFL